MAWREFVILIAGAAVALGYAYAAGRAMGRESDPPVSIGIVFPAKDPARLLPQVRAPTRLARA